MSELAGNPVSRDPAGRFAPGQSGNPQGKAPGTRNRATLLRELMEEGEDRAIVRLVVDKAKGGDAVAARFVVAHLCPRPRARGIEIPLADGLPAHNVVAAHDAVLRALFAGEIAPDEAEAVTRVLDARVRALAAWRQESAVTRFRPDFPALPARARAAAEPADEAGEGADPAPGPSTGAWDAAQDEGNVAQPPSACISPAKAGQRTHDADPPSRLAESGGHLHSACIRQGEQAMTPERRAAALTLLAALTGRAPPQPAASLAGGEDSA
jgi:hypothetical protein